MALGAGFGIAGAGGLYAGRQAVRPVQSTVTEFASFEEQMDAVAAVARVTKGSAAYEALAEKARELGASTSFSAQEVAEAMQFQAMAGFDGNAILASIADNLDLAKATKTGLGETSDISSNILSAFGLDPKEMKRVGDVLTATTTRANVDLIMLGESMKYVAPEAKALGVSLEETAAMAGLLGNVGIQGSQAGTSLRAIYQRLAAPTSKGAAALKELGIRAKTAHGDLRPVPELLAEIGKATEAMGSADRKEIFKELIGVEAGSSFSALIDEKGFAVFQDLLIALKDANGEASRVSKAMGDNLSGDTKGLLSALSELKMVIGEELNPAMREATQWLTAATRGIASWLKENPRLTRAIGFAAIALAGFLIVGGGLLTFLGSITIMLAGMRFGMQMLGLRAMASAGRVGLLGRALNGLRPVQLAIRLSGLLRLASLSGLFAGLQAAGVAALSAIAAIGWPVTALIAAIAAGAFAVWKYWDRISSVVSGFLGGLVGAFTPELDALKNAWASGIDAIAGTIGEAASAIGLDGGKIHQALASAFDMSGMLAGLASIKDAVASFFSGLFSQETLGADQKERFANLGREAAAAFGEAIKSSFKALAGASSFALAAVTGDFRKLQQLFDIDLTEAGRKIITSLLEGMKSVFVQLMAWVDQKIAALKDAFSFNISMPSIFGGGTPAAAPAPALANDNAPVGKYASGGIVRKSGIQLVGERGPELRYASKGEFIAHHGQLRDMAQLSRHIQEGGQTGGTATPTGRARSFVFSVPDLSALRALVPANDSIPAGKNAGVSTAPDGLPRETARVSRHITTGRPLGAPVSYARGGSFRLSMPDLSGVSTPIPANDFTPVGKYASGGIVRKSGIQLVGERGPELRYASKGDFIAHHGQLREMTQLSRRAEESRQAGGLVSYATAEPIMPRLAAATGRAEGQSPADGGQGTGSDRAVSQQTNYNTFHLYGSDPQALAREVSDILERQSRRRMSD
nr:phage tail tape measure protein [Roseibium litorale]